MHLTQSFYPFLPRLPTELQLVVWKFAFHIGPVKSYDGVLNGLESSLKRALKNCIRVSNVTTEQRLVVSKSFLEYSKQVSLVLSKLWAGQESTVNTELDRLRIPVVKGRGENKHVMHGNLGRRSCWVSDPAQDPG